MPTIGTGLPISRLVTVQIVLAQLAAQARSINNIMILGSTPGVIDVVERRRVYANITQVGGDFATSTPEYQAASLWFAQLPQPQILYIGHWAQTATHGQLRGGALSATQQLITNFTNIGNGSFQVSINGASPINITGLSFAGQTNLNGVASTITAAFGGTATMVWNSNYARFELTSTLTGTSSSLSFLSTAPSGTDISALLGMTANTSGAYTANGIAAETALTAVQTIDQSYSGTWYGLVVPGGTDSDHEAIAAYVEASQPPHYYGVTTGEAGSISAVSTNDIGYILSNSGYRKTAVQFSSSNLYAICSYLARILTTDWTGQNTAITLMYKQEPGVIGETLGTTQADALQNKHINVLAVYESGTQLIQYGTSASGDYTDTIIGADALAADIQGEVFNVLYTAPTKVPQTDTGMQLEVNAADKSCYRFVRNGYFGPGVWNAQGFGTLNQGDFLPKSFYTFAAPLATQSASDRAARRGTLIQIAGNAAGAIHVANVLVTIQQ